MLFTSLFTGLTHMQVPNLFTGIICWSPVSFRSHSDPSSQALYRSHSYAGSLTFTGLTVCWSPFSLQVSYAGSQFLYKSNSHAGSQSLYRSHSDAGSQSLYRSQTNAGSQSLYNSHTNAGSSISVGLTNAGSQSLYRLHTNATSQSKISLICLFPVPFFQRSN